MDVDRELDRRDPVEPLAREPRAGGWIVICVAVLAFVLWLASMAGPWVAR
jgi:hypothetical protein